MEGDSEWEGFVEGGRKEAPCTQLWNVNVRGAHSRKRE